LSLDNAQTNATTHPINDQPNNRFTKKIDVALLFFRPSIAGKKYAQIIIGTNISKTNSGAPKLMIEMC
jgi:hypothetical protein